MMVVVLLRLSDDNYSEEAFSNYSTSACRVGGIFTVLGHGGVERYGLVRLVIGWYESKCLVVRCLIREGSETGLSTLIALLEMAAHPKPRELNS